MSIVKEMESIRYLLGSDEVKRDNRQKGNIELLEILKLNSIETKSIITELDEATSNNQNLNTIVNDIYYYAIRVDKMIEKFEFYNTNK
jgi:hypothetical protein